MYSRTEYSSTSYGTVMFETPRRKITMGAKAKSMMRSFNATWTSV